VVLVGRRARIEFTADIRYIARESQKGAQKVLQKVNDALVQLRHFPESGGVDPDALTAPPGSAARKLAVEGFTVRYLYPVQGPRTEQAVLILSIRRAERLPISDEMFLLRYAEEQARMTTNAARPIRRRIHD